MNLKRIEQIAGDMDLTVIDLNNGRVTRRAEPGAQWETAERLRPKADALKVLAFTPFHPAYGVRPRTWQSIRQAIQAYEGQVDWVAMSGDNPHAVAYDNVARQQNKARRLALDGGYDALLSIEADMIIPPDTISALIEANADIAYGLYVWRHRVQRWSAYTDLNLFGGKSIAFWQDKAQDAWGDIIDVAGLGMGCTLIRTDVLKHLRFRLYEGRRDDWEVQAYKPQLEFMGANPYKPRKSMVCTDWMMAMDAAHFGYSQRCNTRVVCGHIDTDGGVLWPDPDAPELYRRDCDNAGQSGEEN